MKKLRLDIEDLMVESFDTNEAATARGTVEGNARFTAYCKTYEEGCSGWDSCGASWCGIPCPN